MWNAAPEPCLRHHLRQPPGMLREELAGVAEGRRVLRARIAIKPALVDALRDRGEAEDGEAEIERPVLDRPAPRAVAICRDITLSAGMPFTE
jgi:hypothetical protein